MSGPGCSITVRTSHSFNDSRTRARSLLPPSHSKEARRALLSASASSAQAPAPRPHQEHLYSDTADPKADIAAALPRHAASTSASSSTSVATGAATARFSTLLPPAPQRRAPRQELHPRPRRHRPHGPQRRHRREVQGAHQERRSRSRRPRLPRQAPLRRSRTRSSRTCATWSPSVTEFLNQWKA